jgi:hypothetical protein
MTSDSISIPSFNRAFFETCCEAGNFFSHTHRTIVLMMEAGKLMPGALYLINDYRTSYTQPITNDDKHALPERLVVIATSIQSLSDKAYSIDFPNDEIEYDISRERTYSQMYCTGTITYRKTQNGNTAYYDHRTILYAWNT